MFFWRSRWPIHSAALCNNTALKYICDAQSTHDCVTVKKLPKWYPWLHGAGISSLCSSPHMLMNNLEVWLQGLWKCRNLIYMGNLASYFFMLTSRVQTRNLPKYLSCISHKAGLSNLRPTGHMRPARQYCVAREVIYILIISWINMINETRKHCITIFGSIKPL